MNDRARRRAERRARLDRVEVYGRREEPEELAPDTVREPPRAFAPEEVIAPPRRLLRKPGSGRRPTLGPEQMAEIARRILDRQKRVDIAAAMGISLAQVNAAATKMKVERPVLPDMMYGEEAAGLYRFANLLREVLDLEPIYHDGVSCEDANESIYDPNAKFQHQHAWPERAPRRA